MRHIPIIKPTLPPFAAYSKSLERIWKTSLLSNFAYYAQKMEKKAQTYLENPHVSIISNCDVGLIITLAALDLKEGSEVLVPSFTFNSTINAILWNRLKPVFIDIDPETFCITPETVKKGITAKTGAILGTHVFGCPCDIDGIQKVAKKHAIPVIYDAAHAYGSLYKGKKVGSSGTHIFSFSGTKVVTSAEGGMIASDSKEFLQKIEYMRNYGFKGDYNSRSIGLNGKISELNAALGCLTLSEVEKQIKRRNSRVAFYKKSLNGVGDITFQIIPSHVRTTYKDFCILTSKRDMLADYLKKKGIMSKKYFMPLHTMDYYRDEKASLPITESVASRALCLPLYNTMKREDIRYVTKTIITFFKKNK